MTTSPDLSQREEINLLLAVIYDFADGGDGSRLVTFLDHIGFDLGAISDPRDLLDALPAFYRIRAGRYDVERLERDLVSWAPIARAISAAAQEARHSKAQPKARVWPNDL